MRSSAEAARTNPYLDARREWNERYGDYIAQARQWRLIALVSGLIALCAVAGVVWIGSQSKLVPYLVAIDRKGDGISGRVATATGTVTEDMIRAQLGGWVEDWRTVSVDAAIQQRSIDRTYAHLSSVDPAFAVVNAYFQSNNPFERGSKETVAVEINSVLRTSSTSMQIEWTEELRDRKGNLVSSASYKAAAMIAITPAATERAIMQNPIGLYIRELSVSRELK